MSCIDRNRFWPARFRRVLCAIIFCLAAVCPAWAQTNFSSLIEQLTRVSDRSSGSPGAIQTADVIASHFKNLGYAQTGTQQFSLPARVQTFSRIQVSGSNRSMDIDPFLSNAISPGTTGQEGISGPVVYVGKGDMADFNGRRIKDTLVVMDLDSSENWINALSLEAGALIYVYPDTLDRFLLEDKLELSPVDFPRFLMPRKKADDLFSNLETLDSTPVTATLYSDLKWDNPVVENVYCLVPGTNADLAQELIIVEAFYDTRGFVPGKSPGADQACSIATLLDLAEFLKDHPPERPVLLVATQGQANALAGMREMVWALDTSSRQLKQEADSHRETQVRQEEHLELLNAFLAGLHLTESQLDQVQETITETLKNQIDTLSNQLMQLRLEKDKDEARIKQLASRRMTLKSLEGKKDYLNLTAEETRLIDRLIPETMRRLQQTLVGHPLEHRTDLLGGGDLGGRGGVDTVGVAQWLG